MLLILPFISKALTEMQPNSLTVCNHASYLTVVKLKEGEKQNKTQRTEKRERALSIQEDQGEVKETGTYTYVKGSVESGR